MKKAVISDIKRFAVHDGNGIRTTVFLKGCPLKCVWCHNPEGISFQPQIAYYEHKCVGCGKCVKICPPKAHEIKNSVHIFTRNLCIECGQCEEVCLGNALKLYGKEFTVSELMPLLLEDRDFYDHSGGGVTLSGGECLAQADFCSELLKELKKEAVSTAVDTCGFVAREALDKVMPYTDVFLYDIKAIDEDVHIKCTGQPNTVILENLKYLDRKNCKIEIRVPYVPGWNDNQIGKIADFLSKLKNIIRVRVLPYHNYAASKYEALGMKNTLPDQLPTDKMIKEAEAQLGIE
ncbi:MAG TPA: glycyl-radical enzyme activating protein [Candidatus Eisenbergiella merdipullorum]|uniref:Glycyl-radical enzyme activating protein n=1 Tax=Candidatus Eisenbergiella merdipullorum TaxID=2838553 RepID=A0A9D2I4L5_9FIRM|nr:glycyl-radical enzyme activating protein [Candidatus Eisenbergiella merdipullorum]